MKTNPIAKSRASLALLTLLLLCFSSPSLRAEVFGLFTYRVVGGTTVEITDYPDDATGPVVIPAVIDGKPVTSVGDNAFRYCFRLTGVTIPNSVTSIGDYAFSGCVRLTGVTIPSSVTSIGYQAFYSCTSLTSVTIPSSVTSIGGWAFAYCSGLTSVSIPSSVTAIGDNAFYSCKGLTSVTIPSSVTSIGESAFRDCTRLTSIVIPSSVTYIGGRAFSSCSRLEAIIVQAGNLQYADVGGVLYNGTQTTLIQYPEGKTGTAYTIPSSVTTIGVSAFIDCTRLTSVVIPSSVTSIGGDTFYGCTGLTSVTIPNSVTSIGDNAFFGCTGLTSVTIPSSVTSIAGFVTIIDEYVGAFSECTSLTSVTLQEGLTTIGTGMFYECTGLTSITIPSSVTTIGDGAFSYSGLMRAVFLGNAPALEYYPFDGTAPGFTIYYLSGSTGFTSQPGTWNGYPATMINEATWPAASWLLTHGFWYDTNLDQDPNGDGVSLLMAYALDLNPHLNLQGSLPQPVLGAGTLSMSFHATSLGITYTVETSTNLQTWTTLGVVQTAPGPDGRATATVPRNAPSRFLRLVVTR